MNDYVILFLIISVCVGLLVAQLWFGYHWIGRINKRAAKLVLKLAAVYVGCVLILEVARVFSRTPIMAPLDTILAPLDLVRFGVSLAMSLIVISVYRVVSASGNESEPNVGDHTGLDLQIGKILDSERFLTVLRSALPKGADDQSNGLDYIPFLLHNLGERQQKFAKRARYCLIATVTLGVIFSTAMMYFGYILVNEAAAGTGKAVATLQKDTESIVHNLDILLPGYYANPAFQRDVAPSLDAIESIEPGQKNTTQKQTVVQAIDRAKSAGDLPSLLGVITTSRSEVSAVGPAEQRYSAALGIAANKLQNFLAERDGSIATLSTNVKSLREAITNVSSSLDKPENRTPEILRRLAIGLAVASFFIVILRYTSSLYRLNYQQELKTMYDDDAARRFYVGYKGSGASEEQRKAVLTAFMTPVVPTSPNGTANADTTGLSNEELGVFKEIIAALSKKL